MNRDQLLDLIRAEGVARVAQALANPPGLQITEGWDLTGWRTQQVPGALLFYPLDGNDISVGPRVLCVNAPETDRAKWAVILAESRAPGNPDTALHLYTS